MRSAQADETIDEREEVTQRHANVWFFAFFASLLVRLAESPFPLPRLGELVILLLLCRGMTWCVCVLWPRWMPLSVVVSGAITGVMLIYVR